MWIFDHVPKTGGTTFLQSWLPTVLLEDEYVRLSPNEYIPLQKGSETSLPHILSRVTPRTRFLGGHYAPHFEGWNRITLVRDPIERAISAYLHERYDSRGVRILQVEKEFPLIHFIEDEFFERLSNYQVKHVLGVKPSQFGTMSDSEIITSLASQYALVGYTEALDTFAYFMYAFLGFPLALFVNKNVREERQSFEASKDEIELLTQFNRHDVRLYNLIKQENDRLLTIIKRRAEDNELQSYIAQLASFRQGNQSKVGRMIRPPRTALLLQNTRLEAFQPTAMAQIKLNAAGAEILVDGPPWGFAAILPVGLSGVSQQHALFIDVGVLEASGSLGLALTTPDYQSVIAQYVIPHVTEAQRIVLRIPAVDHFSLILRQGEISQPSRALISDICVYKDPLTPVILEASSVHARFGAV